MITLHTCGPRVQQSLLPTTRAGSTRPLLDIQVITLHTCHHGAPDPCITEPPPAATDPRKALRGGISKVNFHKVDQLLAIFPHKNEPMAPRTYLGYPHEGPSVAVSYRNSSGRRGARFSGISIPSGRWWCDQSPNTVLNIPVFSYAFLPPPVPGAPDPGDWETQGLGE